MIDDREGPVESILHFSFFDPRWSRPDSDSGAARMEHFEQR
jgi:hypothetical protein